MLLWKKFSQSVKKRKSIWLIFFFRLTNLPNQGGFELLSYRKCIIPYFLRREERSKEASTPSKASPYMGRMQLTTREDPLRQGFGMPRKACAPSGRGMIFYIPAYAAP